MRVVIIEDYDPVLKLLTHITEARGHEVVPIPGGSEALAYFHQGSADLVFVDLSMPEVSGFDIARRLKADERTKRFPLIAVTAHVRSLHKEEALHAGFDGFLPKPVSSSIIGEKINQILADLDPGKIAIPKTPF